MALSGTRTFIQSRDDIIRAALRKIGGIVQGQAPTSEQTYEAAQALNSMVQSWQADGVMLWSVSSATQSLSASVSTYVLSDTTILGAENFYVTINSYDTPVAIMTEEEYAATSVKATEGTPTKILVRRTLSGITLILYPTPSTTGTLNFRKIVRLQDFNISTNNPDFPIEWSLALTYGLACVLAPEYRVSIEERAAICNQAKQYKEAAMKGTDHGSGSVFIAPNLKRRY